MTRTTGLLFAGIVLALVDVAVFAGMWLAMVNPPMGGAK